MRSLAKEAGQCFHTSSCLRLTWLCRADLACHWEDTDTVAQAVFDNVRVAASVLSYLSIPQDTLICFCIAFAVRTSGS